MESEDDILDSFDQNLLEINGEILKAQNKVEMQLEEIEKVKDSIDMFHALYERQIEMLIKLIDQKQKWKSKKIDLLSNFPWDKTRNSDLSSLEEELSIDFEKNPSDVNNNSINCKLEESLSEAETCIESSVCFEMDNSLHEDSVESEKMKLRMFFVSLGTRVISIRYYQRMLYICGTSGFLGQKNNSNTEEFRVLKLNTTEDIIDVISHDRYVYAFTSNRMIIFDDSKNKLLSTFEFRGLFRPVLITYKDVIIIPTENGEIWEYNFISKRTKMILRTHTLLKGVLFNYEKSTFLLSNDGKVTYKSCTAQFRLIEKGCHDIYPGIRKQAICIFDRSFTLTDALSDESHEILLESNIKLVSRSNNAIAILDCNNQLTVYKLTFKAGCRLLRKMQIPVSGEVSALHILDCSKIWLSVEEYIYEFLI